jgi:hypothetical protein
MSGIRIAHIINPVKVKPDRDLYFQQPIVFESINNAIGELRDVELWSVYYPEDKEMSPVFAYAEIEINDSILDIGTWKVPRKLPLIKDIMDALYEASDADIFIYTNADIGLQPYFYDTVKAIFESGKKAFCINKRLLPEHLNTIEQLPLIYCGIGNSHNGHDCFVFARELYPKFDLGTVCLGAPWTEGTFIASMVNAFSEFTVYKNAHLTWHLGDRRTWNNMDQMDYRIHCCNEFARVVRKFSEDNKDILEHITIKYLLGKLVKEVKLYDDERYSEDARYFAKS